jgi:GNAT superfamily N-acetyltransferase
MTVLRDIDKTSDAAVRAGLLATVEALHRQLRPKIPSPYADWIERMLSEGAHLVALVDEGVPRALAIWRTYHTTFNGLRFYVDDLVTDAALRSRGHGGQLLAALEARSRALGCDTFTLESSVVREAAHRFYFRAGMTIVNFSFAKRLTDRF